MLILNDIPKSYYKYHLDKWGKPQIFKEIELYPIKLIDEDMYYSFSRLLCHNKNSIPDKEVIRMSYLKFIVYILSSSWNEELYIELQNLFSYITKKDVTIQFQYLKHPVETYGDIKLQMQIGEYTISEIEFDYMREMILEQNGLSIEYVNQYDKTLEDSLNFVNRNNSLTLEEQLFSLVADAGQPISKFEDYTFYQFQKHFGRLSLNIEYKTFKPLEASGQISFKHGGTIDHWLKHVPQKGRYDDILINKDSYVNNSDIFKSSKTI